MFGHLNFLSYLLLAVPSLVTSHAGHTQPAGLYPGISNPLRGGGLTLEGSALANQATGNLDISLQGPGHRTKLRRSHDGNGMLGGPSSFDNLPSSAPRGTTLTIAQLPPWSPSSSSLCSLPNSPPGSRRAGPTAPFKVSSSLTAGQTRRFCGLLKNSNPRTLPREAYEKFAACCTSGANGCLTSWGSLVRGMTNLQVAAPLLSGGTIAGLSRMDDARKLRAAGRPPGPRSHVKLRRSQEGARLPGIRSAPPSLHGPPSPHSPPSPYGPPSVASMPSSPQHGASARFETSSSQGEAEVRRRCSSWSRLTEAEKHHMRRICCKVSTGACLIAAGGGVSAASQTLAGLPLALGGLAVSLSALTEFERAGITQPRSSAGPTPPVKRRRYLMERRLVENEMKEEGNEKGEEGWEREEAPGGWRRHGSTQRCRSRGSRGRRRRRRRRWRGSVKSKVKSTARRTH